MTVRPTPQYPLTVRVFTQRFSATPRGARLARRLALHQLDTWGIPHGTEASDTVALIVAELSANAVTHGRVPGRDFELCLSLVTGSVRVEVSDTRAGVRPPGPRAVRAPGPLDDAGRGLYLVDALAARWEVVDREPPPGKTVRAEVDVLNWLSLARRTSHRPVGQDAPATGGETGSV
ncbi:ATP-binding protein [Streptomyces sp. NBC_00582]|uniref:ATP-binding protein n=1 Tax=Streptomyces sp. NBC_00582 TaxID=2975783 RepID=UPI002E81D7FF|nr:ATP-binding protein [Streptomyces sp. NBC_00582]WUB64966.1 ATP-binding protein [Streptomyces sp. NBC_00582]